MNTDKMTLSDTISSLSQLSEHLIQLVDAQSIPIPPLLDNASIERFRNDDHIQTTVHQFQKYIQHIHSAHAILGRAVKTLEWHVNSVHNAKAAISRLPVEVIDRILRAGHQEPSDQSDLLYPLVISHVCQSWRAVALGSSWLWEWVSPYWPRPQLFAWLCRVHQHPISIWVLIDEDRWYSRDIERSLEFSHIAQGQPKYRVLSINAQPGVPIKDYQILGSLKEIQRALPVETLILNFLNIDLPGECVDSEDLEFIRHLFLHQCHRESINLMTVKLLVSLSISGDFHDDWWEIVAQLSGTLETLILIDLSTHNEKNHNDPIRLDNLQHLIIGIHRSYRADPTFMSWIWRRIRAPGLRHLAIFSDWDLELGNTLGDGSDLVHNFLGLIQDTQNLEQVRVGGSPKLTAIILKALGNVHGHVKHLRRISLATSKRRVIKILAEFLRSRREDPQLSAIAELDIILHSSSEFVDETHLRETFRSEVEYITVKKSTEGLYSFLKP